MKKLGTFALGTLLFFAVSCNKNKTSLEPKKDTSYVIAPSDIRDDEDNNHTGEMLRTQENGPSTKTPVSGVRNDEVVNPWTHTERSVVPGARDDEDINPNTSDW